jgi:excisionase family DNA binding protein
MERLLSLKEVADYLRVSVWTAYRMVNSRQIPAFKIGSKSWRVQLDDIDACRYANEVTGQVGRHRTGRKRDDAAEIVRAWRAIREARNIRCELQKTLDLTAETMYQSLAVQGQLYNEESRQPRKLGSGVAA